MKITNVNFFLSVFFIGVLVASSSRGASTSDAPPAKAISAKSNSAKPSSPKVLDFDADVIEGERKTPSVFLEIGTENPTMDSVIFNRNDFNDFHALDSKRRQQYQPLYSK